MRLRSGISTLILPRWLGLWLPSAAQAQDTGLGLDLSDDSEEGSLAAGQASLLRYPR